ncbi:MAG: adenylate/guanylate cyclase domain-containing protein [Lachnospiraceae bacterium]|nr:adenylate/guanylate cyclase domain-containing protein [Lachnospiraceae bacterium]
MKKKLISLLEVIIPVLLFMVLVITEPFYSPDAFMCDSLYSKMEGTDRRIKIITVDEETLEAYGNFEEWSREKIANLIELLCADKEHMPSVIALDFLFTGETDKPGDGLLVQACKNGCPVIVASNLVYRGKTEKTGSDIRFNKWNVELVETPYEALDEQVKSGFTNAYLAQDGKVRYTKLYETMGKERIDSLAWLVYEEFLTGQGLTPKMPRLDARGLMHFSFSGVVGEYSHLSLSEVLKGNIPASEFEDCIVFVGAYAPGFQDAYMTAAERDSQMYGVEIQANIVQALLDGKTAVPASVLWYIVIAGMVLAVFFFVARKQKLLPVVIEAIVLMVGHVLIGKFLAGKGYTITQIYFVLILVMGVLYQIIGKYVAEKLRRRKLLSTFKKYVAHQVVDELAKDDSFKLRLGGEKRDIAVLFVDIRGFTPLSERLAPEEVVKVLNEYLNLTTSCILRNEGMLDKFIGDATMAVFNAPIDLEDYTYKAVKTALDMQAGAKKLRQDVSFGIGVNCGEAVVGNIGCEFRMDYTAIGDTVNTAARLESRAPKGEILISEQVYERVKDRVEAEYVGEMELKGKSNIVKTYRVIKEKES